MRGKHQQLFNLSYLRSVWARQYDEFKESEEAGEFLARLKGWAAKDWQKESASEGAFVDLFFKRTWGYRASGEGETGGGYTLEPQFPVKGAGGQGGTGAADLALGHFGREDIDPVPQVLAEFKDDRSGLDRPQAGRPSGRSPVDQCLDYLREARRGLISPVLPTWGLVTDMNEFRLYYYGNKAQHQRFILRPTAGDLDVSLLGEGEEAAFQRFVFHRLFHAGNLLTTGGKSPIEKLLGEQITHEQALENEFYREYRAYRESIYQALRQYNPVYEATGRLRQLVKFTQRILDRCLFILYCEDMGRELSFPPNVLRDVLIETAEAKYFSPEGTEAWTSVKRLFTSMRDGTPFGEERINEFNGGLFEADAELDALVLPNAVFCEKNQGQNADRLLRYPKTLLYFSAKYNFGAMDNGGERTLTLTAMGRIFEQSITELEVMEARAEGRESLTLLTKRKTDGVYYTPEWVTHYIVEETVGARLAEIRRELGFDRFAEITRKQIDAHRKSRRAARIVGEYEKALHLYGEQLDQIKVVDPACGSGAFLIQAFKHLYDQRQWVANELERITGEMGLFDTHGAMRAVLSTNLYGVDINAESVEITRLALWLHTALPDRPLTSLDENIRCGNSLIGHDFYDKMDLTLDLFTEDERERVNTFDWKEAFPEVFERGNAGFDCVIGNPPYVKLQHFRKVQEDVAAYLLDATRNGGHPLYESTQTGNFDLYLPFVERGIELLNRQGRMGYIAPNVWLVNDYGRALRRKVKRLRCLDRWVDFKSHQVFEEAITYTALQFFRGSPVDAVRCVFAPHGEADVASIDWEAVKDKAVYKELPEGQSWNLMPGMERRLFDRLRRRCTTLADVCTRIIVGLQTSADYVYHLDRIGPGRYRHFPKVGRETTEVEIEDEIMKPLVSGPEAKRYQVPATSTFILFPYKATNGKAELMPASDLRSRYPKAWKYLKSHEGELRHRENGVFDDEAWYRFGRHQNIDKQEIPKLCVAQTVPELRVCFDSEGTFYFNNVRVNGIIPSSMQAGWFLLGILNAPVCDYVFKRIAKPKSGGYFEANKQFIAPLPIPPTTPKEKRAVAKLARRLQDLHTKRRDLMVKLQSRLDSPQCEDVTHREDWIWADVKPVATLKEEAPERLKGAERTRWARESRERRLAGRLDPIDALLRPGAALKVGSEDADEVHVLIDGRMVIRLFLDPDEALFVAAQWRQKFRQTTVREKFDARRLLSLLLGLKTAASGRVRRAIVDLDAEIQILDAEIDEAEGEMNRLTYELYGLTAEEIRLVEQGG